MTKQFVLDAWAILAFLQREEPAATRVRQLLESAVKGEVALSISIINLGEAIYRVGKVKGEPEALTTLDDLRRLPLTLVPAIAEAVFAAVRYKIKYPISYADAFAVATANEAQAVLVTGDPELIQLESQVRLEKLARR